MSALPFTEWMAVTQDRAESALGRFLPGADSIPARLHQAMRYATLGGGKRVRPLLAFAAGAVLGLPYQPWSWLFRTLVRPRLGAAAELEDAAVDLGTPVPTLATRAETAEALTQTYPDVPLPQVAGAVDAGVFGPGQPTDEAAAASASLRKASSGSWPGGE